MRFQKLINVSLFAASFCYVALGASAADTPAKAKPATKAATPVPLQMATIPPRATPTATTSATSVPAVPAVTPGGAVQLVVPTVPPPPTPKPTATPVPTPAPTETTTKTKGPRIGFKIVLNLTRGAASTSIRTTVNTAKGESVVIGGLIRTLCKDNVCPSEKEKTCPQKCETLHEDIKFTLTDYKNDVIQARFEVVGPLPADHVGFVVTGKIYTTISFNLQGDLKVKLLLTPSPL